MANPSSSITKGRVLTSTKDKLRWRDDQTWCKTSSRLRFIDETEELIGIYDESSSESATRNEDQADESDCNAPVRSEHVRSPRSPPATVAQRDATALDLEDYDDQAGLVRAFKRRRLDSSGTHESISLESPVQQSSGLRTSSFPDLAQGSSAPQNAALFHSPSDGTYAEQLTADAVVQSVAGDANVQHEHLTFRSDPTSNFFSPTFDSSIPYSIPSGSGVANQETASELDLLSPSLQRAGTQSWPLQGPEEAHLLRYFIDTLALNFDICDPRRHFQLIVPQRAAHCPILLNAIFAVSAKHLSSLHPNYDPLISDRYHGECIKHLIPMLNDEQAVFDEDLMAATVILRYLEEVGVPVSGTTEQNHLLGTRVFLSAQDATLLNGGLREAAFWIGLRQEIYVAFVNQRSVIPTLEHLQFDQTFEPAEDHVWANRIIAHCAEVLRYCFGEDLNSMTPSRYTELTSYAENWVHMKPTSFTPMFVGTPSVLDDDVNTVFPQIWYVSDAVTTGCQHYHLAHILLLAHSPRLPRLGPGLRKALKEIDKEIRNDVIALCGMATGNSRTPPNYVTASMAIAMAGDRFEDRREQEALMQVLVYTERVHAWPTGAAQEGLKEAWGWI